MMLPEAFKNPNNWSKHFRKDEEGRLYVNTEDFGLLFGAEGCMCGIGWNSAQVEDFALWLTQLFEAKELVVHDHRPEGEMIRLSVERGAHKDFGSECGVRVFIPGLLSWTFAEPK